MPAVSFTELVTRAVYTVPALRADEGVKVAIFPEYVTVPGITEAPCFRPMVDAEIVEASISSLNVTLTVVETETEVALLSGVMPEMVGGVVSDAEILSFVQDDTTKANTNTVANKNLIDPLPDPGIK